MLDKATKIAATLLLLVFSGASEELLPKPCATGFPVLLAVTGFMAFRGTSGLAVAFAILAGTFEDAISGLPPFTSVSYFILFMVLIRWSSLPVAGVVFAYPAYQMWLWLWASPLQGGLFSRVLLALPLGYLTAMMVVPALDALYRKAAL